jgi:hypothetical protein
MLEVTSEGNFFMLYRQESIPESLSTAGKLTREGESVRSEICYWLFYWRAGLSYC